jgi:hypothetical protein
MQAALWAAPLVRRLLSITGAAVSLLVLGITGEDPDVASWLRIISRML